VRRDKRPDRPPLNETIRRRMGRYSVENPRKNLLLEFFQSPLWRFNQPDLTARFWQNSVMIVMQLLELLPIPQPFEIGEPQQIP
jgi:hypothetical protein